MTSFSPMPDVEAVCVSALRAADVADGRAYGAVPAEPEFPLILVQRVGGQPSVRRRLDRASIQVSAYGEDKAEARDAADAARLALMNAEATYFEELSAYVTGVEDELGLQWLPDPDTTRARYIFTVSVSAHHREP